VNYSRQHQLAIGLSRVAAYQHVLHLVTGLLVLGLFANLFVRPVASRFWMERDAPVVVDAS
jgi:hypothetical protein